MLKIFMDPVQYVIILNMFTFWFPFRQLFSELRVAMENICSSPSCPAFVRNIVYKVIAFISRLAPQIPTA